MAHVTIEQFITWLTAPKIPRPHLLLGAKHSDTDVLNPSVLRGHLMVGDATPAWSILALGADEGILSSDGTDVIWEVATGTGVPVRKASPTLTTPTIADFSNAAHDHADAAGGATLDHGALTGRSDDDHTIYVLHTLSTAASNFLVGSGSNTWVKKTLAEVGEILEADLDHGNLQGLTDNDHPQYTTLAMILALGG